MDGELARVAAAQGGFVFRWQALDTGCTDAEISVRLRHRDWVRLRRGAYADARLWDALDDAGRHLLILRAVVANLSGRVVVTGYSALAALGVPLWGVDLAEVQLHREEGKSSRREAGVNHHLGPLCDNEVREVGGLLVTIPERALVDACRQIDFEAGVVLADGAFKLPGFQVDAAKDTVERQRDWPFSIRASKVLGFADRRAATVGESRARVLLTRIGAPAPDLQRPIVDSLSNRLLGVSDFYVDQFRTAIEFDGKLKYGRALYEADGRLRDVDLGDVVWQEKKREDSFRDDGHEVGRLIWADLEGRDREVGARLWRTFRRGESRRSSA